MRTRDPSDIRLVRAEVKIDGSTIFVAFCRAEEGYPFTIENDSDYSITMAQAVSYSSLCKFISPDDFLLGWQSRRQRLET